MIYGHSGNILHVDLGAGTTELEHPGEQFYRLYAGGSALNAFYLLRNMPPKADALSAENVLGVSVGFATGAVVPGQSRVVCTAKSPLTGAIGDSQAGGFWPAELKSAGLDAIIVSGRAEQPVYLWIHDGKAELRDARHLWGKVTGEAEALIRAELADERIQVMQIGPAGEKLARIAAVINMCNRANGRTGMGAVMGSKNLKAIAVRGHGKVALHDAAKVISLARWGAREAKERLAGLSTYGTAGIVESQNAMGGLPTRNWHSGVFAGASAISGETMHQSILRERDTCYACPVRCKRVVEVQGPVSVDPLYGGPEYESIAALGSYCCVDDLVAIAKANEICNKYGMDTVSCGATIAFAMECFEEGILTPEDTGGILLTFGSATAMVKTVEMMGRREGIGDILADGSAQAARKLGPKAQQFVVAVKGLEVPAHMPQVKRSLGLIYAVNPFGADHESSEHDPSYSGSATQLELARLAELGLCTPQAGDSLGPEKIRFAWVTQLFFSALDSLCLCNFVWGPAWQLYGPSEVVTLVRAVTGWDFSLQELLRIGERRLNLLRAFNAMEGSARSGDTLPARLFESLQGGPTDGIAMSPSELERALDSYYDLAGWNRVTGIPTRAKLEELDLSWVADKLSHTPHMGPR